MECRDPNKAKNPLPAQAALIALARLLARHAARELVERELKSFPQNTTASSPERNP